MKPDISVIIKNYNHEKELAALLACLENQTKRSFEIIIGDDGSSDNSKKVALQHMKQSNLSYTLFCQEDKGFRLSTLINNCISFSSADKLILLDADMLVGRTFVEEYLNQFKRNKKSILCGKILYIKTEFVEKILKDPLKYIDKLSPFLFNKEDSRIIRFNNVAPYKKVWGGNVGLYKKAVMGIGGFDEEFTEWGGEDTDLGFRLMRLGYSIKLLDDCTSYHLGADFPPLKETLNRGGVKLFEKKLQSNEGIVRNENPPEYDEILRVYTNRRDKIKWWRSSLI